MTETFYNEAGEYTQQKYPSNKYGYWYMNKYQ